MKIKRWILVRFDEDSYLPSEMVYNTYEEAHEQMKKEVLWEDPEMKGEYTELEEMYAHTEEGEWYWWRIFGEEIELTDVEGWLTKAEYDVKNMKKQVIEAVADLDLELSSEDIESIQEEYDDWLTYDAFDRDSARLTEIINKWSEEE